MISQVRMMKMDGKRACRRCGLPVMLMPGNREALPLDEDGICIYCRLYDDYDFLKDPCFDKRKACLDEAIESLRGQNRYDAVVMFTGGKDSAYTACILKEQYGLKVLALTWENGFFGPDQRANIDNMVKSLDLEHRFVSLDRDVLADFFRNRLRNYGRFCSCLLPALFFCSPLIDESEAPLIFISTSYGQVLGGYLNMVLRHADNPDAGDLVTKTWQGPDLALVSLENDYFYYAMLRDILVGELAPTTVKVAADCLRAFNRLRARNARVAHLTMCMACLPDTMVETISAHGWVCPAGAAEAGHTSCVVEPLKGYLAYRQDMLNPDFLELAAARRSGRCSEEQFSEDVQHLGYFMDEPRECVARLLDVLQISREEFDEIVKARRYANKTAPAINEELFRRLPVHMPFEELKRHLNRAYSFG